METYHDQPQVEYPSQDASAHMHEQRPNEPLTSKVYASTAIRDKHPDTTLTLAQLAIQRLRSVKSHFIYFQAPTNSIHHRSIYLVPHIPDFQETPGCTLPRPKIRVKKRTPFPIPLQGPPLPPARLRALVVPVYLHMLRRFPSQRMECRLPNDDRALDVAGSWNSHCELSNYIVADCLVCIVGVIVQENPVAGGRGYLWHNYNVNARVPPMSCNRYYRQ